MPQEHRRTPTQPFTLDGEGVCNFAVDVACSPSAPSSATSQCVKIPDDVPLTSAALVGCGVVTGMGAVFNRANVQLGRPRPCSASAASAST